MKKFLIMVFCIFVVTFAFASGTRVASFGEITFGDAVEVGIYPGLRTNFTNYFSATMKTPGDDNNYTGGVVFDLGPGVFALGLNGKVNPIVMNEVNHTKSISLAYGMELESLNIGAKVITVNV